MQGLQVSSAPGRDSKILTFQTAFGPQRIAIPAAGIIPLFGALANAFDPTPLPNPLENGGAARRAIPVQGAHVGRLTDGTVAISFRFNGECLTFSMERAGAEAVLEYLRAALGDQPAAPAGRPN